MNKMGSFREIQNVVWPKDYDYDANYNDIALVELKTRLPMSALVKPACLPTTEYVRHYPGTLMVSVPGFG